jgi:exonuclease SbcC
MLLKRLIIENLRSYKKQEIHFPKGSVLLSGDIGSGKTTVLLAIEFALFGLQPGQKGSSLLRNNEDFGNVELEFEIENQNIIIQRSLKRIKKSVNQDYSAIIINGEKFEESVTEIKNRVLNIINYPSEFAKKNNLLYKFTVYTPQEEMKQIILEPGDLRLNTLRHVFGIDKYKRIEENSLIFLSKLREKIKFNSGLLYDLETLKHSLNQKKDQLIVTLEKQKKFKEDYNLSLEKRINKEKELELLLEKINEKKNLENEKSKSLIVIEEKSQQINATNSNIKTLSIQIEEAKKLYYNTYEMESVNNKIIINEKKEKDLQKEYINIISEINSLELRKKESILLKNKISLIKNCPTCLQEVSETYKINIFNKTEIEIEFYNTSIKQLAIKKDSLSKEMDELKKINDNLKKLKSDYDIIKYKLENLREKELRLIELENNKSLLEKDLEILKKHVISLDESIKSFIQYDKLYSDNFKELNDLKIIENKNAIKNAEINKEIEFLNEEIREKNDQIIKKEILSALNEKLKEIEYFVSEKFLNLILFTEKQVMLSLKEEFSMLFSRWFSILVSENLSAKLDDNFSPLIELEDYELDYSFLSGGERTAIALAYRLSLNQVINSLLSNIKTKNLVILDEPTDGFSEQQLDKMSDVLHQLKVDQLILVSHEQKIEGYVENIIRFNKIENETKVLD